MSVRHVFHTKAKGNLALRMLKEQGGLCAYCLEPTASPVIDHMIPYSYSHNNSASNLIAVCPRCNAKKGARIFSSLGAIREFLRPRGSQGASHAKEVPL